MEETPDPRTSTRRLVQLHVLWVTTTYPGRKRRGGARSAASRGSGRGSTRGIRQYDGSRRGNSDSLQRLLEEVSQAQHQDGFNVAQSLQYLQRLVQLQKKAPRREWQASSRIVLDAAWPVLLASDKAHMGPAQVRLALYCLARLRLDERDGYRDVSTTVVSQLAARAAQVADRMNTFQVSNTLWALQSLRVRHWSPQPLVISFLRQVYSATSVHCSMFVYACHKLGWDNEEDYRMVISHFVSLRSMNASLDYSNLIWATSDRLHQPPEELGVLLESFLKIGTNLYPQSVSNVLVALQKWQLRYTQREELRLVGRDGVRPASDVAVDLIEQFKLIQDQADLQQLSNVMWASVKAGWGSVALLRPIFEEFHSRQEQGIPQDYSNVLWAVAKLHHGDKNFVDLCTSRFCAVVHRAKAQECSNALWALAVLNRPDHTVACQKIGKRFEEVLDSANAQACSNVVWALGKLDLTQMTPLVRASLDRSLQQGMQLTTQGCATLLGVAGSLGATDRVVASQFLQRMVELEGSWKLQEVAQMVRGLRLAGFQALPPEATGLLQFVVSHVEECNADDCATMIDGLSGLVEASDPRLQVLVDKYAQMAFSLTNSSRYNVAKILEEMEYNDQHLLRKLRQ